MSPLNKTGRSYADNLFAKQMEQISAQQQKKVAAIRLEYADRNMTMSGMHMTAYASVLAEQIKLLGKAKADCLLTAYRESGIPTDASSIAEITSEVLAYCRTQQTGAANAMRNVIRQTFQGQVPPNLERAVVEGLDILVGQASTDISRDLRIKRDQAELERIGIAKKEEILVPTWDVFICHASEDKDSFVRPLARALSASLKVWYDETALNIGDSLRQKIDYGLANCRYGIVVLSKAFFSKNWPQAELDGLLSREMAGTHVKVILPVWHDVSLQEVRGYSPILSDRFAANSKEGLDFVVAKLHAAMNLGSNQTDGGSNPQLIAQEPKEYFEQRRKMPETVILKKIWTKPRWRISIFPTEFRKARFRNTDHCKQFMLSSYVRVRGWYPYPWFSKDALETDDEWIAGEIDESHDGSSRMERFVLFRSALFAHNRAFDVIPQLGDRVHALEILDTTTGAFELAARMARFGVLDPAVALTFELHGVEGRELTWPQNVFGDNEVVSPARWCQEESLNVSRQIGVADISTQRREFAVDVSFELYSKFGWQNPPRERLQEAQRNRFGPVEFQLLTRVISRILIGKLESAGILQATVDRPCLANQVALKNWTTNLNSDATMRRDARTQLARLDPTIF